jgi:hypothetical protein
VDRRVRRRNWLVLFLVAVSVPALAYLGLLLAIGLGLSGAY